MEALFCEGTFLVEVRFGGGAFLVEALFGGSAFLVEVLFDGGAYIYLHVNTQKYHLVKLIFMKDLDITWHY